jgi:hypothetical protein
MAQTTNNRRLGQFLSLLRVVGDGKGPSISRFERGRGHGRHWAWWTEKKRKHPSNSRFKRGRGVVVALG